MGAKLSNQRWLRHDKTRLPDLGERRAVTVCIATLFLWNYGTTDNPQYGYAALTASDRMLTVWDSKFEPQKRKTAHFAPKIFAMVSGDIALHSEVIAALQREIPTNPNKTPENIALLYGTKNSNNQTASSRGFISRTTWNELRYFHCATKRNV
jgi:hypothetical protein